MQFKAVLARIQVWHVLILAFALRLAWALWVPVQPVSDPSVYDLLAKRLAAGLGYTWPDGSPTAYWPVGTSALYALIYATFGTSSLVVSLANLVLGVALVAATYGLASTQFSRPVSLLAAFLAAIWPTWIAFTTIPSSELPGNLFLVTGLACALSRTGQWWLWVIVSTVLLVGAAFFRANMLPFIIFVPLLVAIRDRQLARFIPAGLLAVLVATLLIAPWAIRNQRIFGAIVPISTNLGANLWIGNNPSADGGYVDPPATGEEPLPKNEVAQDRIYQRHAKAYILAHPLRYLELCARRLMLALDRETFGVGWNNGLPDRAKTPLKIVMTGYWYAIFLTALAGLALFVWRRPANLLSPFVLVPAAALASPVLVMSTERYHYPIAPFVAIFAAFALTRSFGERGTALEVEA